MRKTQKRPAGECLQFATSNQENCNAHWNGVSLNENWLHVILSLVGAVTMTCDTDIVIGARSLGECIYDVERC